MRGPAIFFVSADNQQYDSEFFGQEERMLFAGDIRKDREKCLERIYRGLKTLLEDGAMRDRMKEALGRITDGCGAARIATQLVSTDSAAKSGGGYAVVRREIGQEEAEEWEAEEMLTEIERRQLR